MKRDEGGTSDDSDESPNSDAATAELQLAGIVNAIGSAIAHLKKHATAAVEAARAIGHNLILAKKFVAHGQWKTWIEQNVPLALRTVQLYMELSERMDALPYEKAQQVALLPIQKAMDAIRIWPQADDEPAKGAAAAERDSDAGPTRESCANVLTEMSMEFEHFAYDVRKGKQIDIAIAEKLRRAISRALSAICEYERRHSLPGSDKS